MHGRSLNVFCNGWFLPLGWEFRRKTDWEMHSLVVGLKGFFFSEGIDAPPQPDNLHESYHRP
jgi:hypothetical protein